VRCSQLLLASGGSGLTPLLQIANAALADPDDATQVFLALFHHSPRDVVGDALVRDLVKRGRGRVVAATFVSTKEDDTRDGAPAAAAQDAEGEDEGAGDKVGGGEITGIQEEDEEDDEADDEWIQGRVGADTLGLVWPKPAEGQVAAWCGPPGFCVAVDRSARSMLYRADLFFQF
jgi:NAD(P)H-flavin reductase